VNRAFAVKVLGIAHMEGIEIAGQSARCSGNADQMYMIGHEAIGPNIYRVAGGIFLEPVQIAPIVGVRRENWLIVVPPLDDMVRVS